MSAGNSRSHNRTLRNTASDLSDAAEELKDEAGESIGTMADACSSQAAHMAETVRDLGTKAGRAAREGVEQLRKTAGAYVEQGRDKAMDLEHTFEDQIKGKPLQSLLIAAGVGFAIGFLMTRSSRA